MNVSPLPWWLVLSASASAAYLIPPLVFVGSRVPWDQPPAVFSGDEVADALSLSLKTCTVALAIDPVLGAPLAVALSKDWRGVSVLRVLVALPLAFPPVVTGIALVAVFGRRDMLGSQLETPGMTVASMTTAVVLAQVFVPPPFLVVTVEAALRSCPRGLEETAVSLGVRPTRVFASVALPMVVPGVACGATPALARCLGEFGAMLTFAGSLQGITHTPPIQVYLARESADKTDLALGIAFAGVAAFVVAATEMPARGRRCVREGENPDDGGDPDAVDAPQSLQSVEKTAVPLRVEEKVVERGWDVSIDVGAGKVLAAMGHNGAGKSTLAEVLSGSLALDSGAAQTEDLIVGAAGASIPPQGHDVAMVSQNPWIFEHMTVLANVAFPLVYRGFPRAQTWRFAREQLKKVGCKRLAACHGGQFLGGQVARVALARVPIFSPRLLILDEPTAAFDVEVSLRVGAVLVDRLKSDGTTTVLMTHDVTEAAELGTRMIMLERERAAENGSPAEALACLISVFGVSPAGLNAVVGVLRIDGDGLPSTNVGGGQELTAAEASGIVAGQPVMFMFVPEAVTLSSGKVVGSTRSSLPATVERVSTAGGLVTVRFCFPNGTPFNARITLAVFAELALASGDEAVATVEATQVRAVGAGRSVSTTARDSSAEADMLTRGSGHAHTNTHGATSPHTAKLRHEHP